jgi:hypothetical protein
MKTAMQELIDLIRFTDKECYATMFNEGLFDKALEKEKEQIADAWDAGMSEGIGTMMADLDWDGEFVNYYKETYGE